MLNFDMHASRILGIRLCEQVPHISQSNAQSPVRSTVSIAADVALRLLLRSSIPFSRSRLTPADVEGSALMLALPSRRANRACDFVSLRLSSSEFEEVLHATLEARPATLAQV